MLAEAGMPDDKAEQDAKVAAVKRVLYRWDIPEVCRQDLLATRSH